MLHFELGPRECWWQTAHKGRGLLRLLSLGLVAMILEARVPSGVGVSQAHDRWTSCPVSQRPSEAGVFIAHFTGGKAEARHAKSRQWYRGPLGRYLVCALISHPLASPASIFTGQPAPVLCPVSTHLTAPPFTECHGGGGVWWVEHDLWSQAKLSSNRLLAPQ